jgi:hypothetical protein
MRFLKSLWVCLLLPSLCFAHHSFAEFDQQRTVEIAGILRDVAWENPHVKLKVQTVEAGKAVVWDIECHSVGVLSRSNVSLAALRVGDRVKLAGNPSKVTPARMFGTNLLTASGMELVMAPGVKQRWKADAAAFGRLPASSTEQPPTRGLFKVWGSDPSDPETSPRALWSGKMDLTPAAQKSLAAWDPVHDRMLIGCNPKGMPTIMEQPYGMQFEDKGSTILLRLEEYDTVRTIHLSDGSQVPQAKTLLGYSVGHWEGETLVVSTTNISWPYITDGVRQGPASRIEERFAVTPDGKRLTDNMTITDPITFTKSAVLKRAWVWRASERVNPYQCGTRQKIAKGA